MSENNEGIPWFWRIFGPALIGFVGVLLAIILNGIHSNTVQCRVELATNIVENKKQADAEITKIKDTLRQLEVSIAAIEEFKTTAKEKLVSIESLVKEKTQANDSNLTVIRQTEKELSDRLSGWWHRFDAPPWCQRAQRAVARHRLSLRHTDGERHRLDRDGTSRGLLRLQGRGHAELAAVSHDRHSRRLHDFFGILARCDPAV